MVCQSHWWWFWSLSLGLAHYTYLKPRIWDEYPVVNIQKTMEHHHFYWETPLNMAMASIAFSMFTRPGIPWFLGRGWENCPAWTSGDGGYGWDPTHGSLLVKIQGFSPISANEQQTYLFPIARNTGCQELDPLWVKSCVVRIPNNAGRSMTVSKPINHLSIISEKLR